ncbi:MAG TPA: YegP family protein [Bryobacteraceae bacterium]|nr:YegP family protein [Bryobacteraceae bacterium]
MKATFEIKKAVDGRFVFNLKAANDQVVLTSQAYETKESAESGIASVKQNAPFSESYEEKTGSDGLPYFVLHAANRQVIGRSQMYSSREAMHNGIASVKHNAPLAETVDLSAQVHSAGGKGSRGA